MPRSKSVVELDKPTRRSSGRPSAGEASVGRETLIDKTIELLKTTPPDQLTLVSIAEYAGVNLSLLKYYFKDRSTLMVAATEKLVSRVTAVSEEAAERAGSTPEAKLKARISALLQLEVENRFFHRLVIDEIYNSDRPSSREHRRLMAERGVSRYADVLAEGQAKHGWREIDPLFLYISILGMCGFFVSGEGVLRQGLGGAFDQQKLIDRYADFMIDILMHGINPGGYDRRDDPQAG